MAKVLLVSLVSLVFVFGSIGLCSGLKEENVPANNKMESRSGRFCSYADYSLIDGWLDASKSCSQFYGTELASIGSAPEFDEFKTFLAQYPRVQRNGFTQAVDGCIGLFRSSPKGDYEYLDGLEYSQGFQFPKRMIQDSRDGKKKKGGFGWFSLSEDTLMVGTTSSAGNCVPVCNCPVSECCEYVTASESDLNSFLNSKGKQKQSRTMMDQCRTFGTQTECQKRSRSEFCDWHACSSQGSCVYVAGGAEWEITCPTFGTKYECHWEDPQTKVNREMYCHWMTDEEPSQPTRVPPLPQSQSDQLTFPLFPIDLTRAVIFGAVCVCGVFGVALCACQIKHARGYSSLK